MGQSCCTKCTPKENEILLEENRPEQLTNKDQSDTLAENSHLYQARINELENNVQISIDVISKLNLTIENLVVQVEMLNKQLEKKEELQESKQNDNKEQN